MESARCRAFVASAEEGSFTAAGKRLDYTPSGVSQLVRAFEEELGFPLLTRRNRGVILTREGESVFPQVVEFIKKEDAMFAMARKVSELEVGSITIATFTSIATHILPKIIKDFSRAYNNIGIKIVEGSKEKIEELLSENKADLAFVSRLDNTSYTWIPFMDDNIVAVLSREHRLAGEAAYPISESKNDDLIMPDGGRDLDVLNLLKTSGISPEVKFSTIENYTAINMAGKGLGVNIVNEFITKSWESDCVILPLDPPASVQFGIAIPSYETTTPAVKKFLTFAVKDLGEEYK